MKSGSKPINLEEALELAAALVLTCVPQIEDDNLKRVASIIYKEFLMYGYLDDFIKEGSIVLPSKQNKPRDSEGLIQAD